MPYNGSGTFTLVAGNPVVTNTTISSTVHNNTMSDIVNNGLSNAITKDGQTTVTANIPLSTYKITGMGNATALQDAVTALQMQNNGLTELSSVAGTDTITAAATPVPSAYATGQIFTFEPAVTNTGAATINISSLGAKSIYLNNAALVAGVLVSGQPVSIRYNGTQFEIISKSDMVSLNAATQTIAGLLGLGVSPSAWLNTKALDVGSFGALSVDTATTGATSLSFNAYAESATSWKYKTSANPASRYTQDSSGDHRWLNAPSGTAGNAITFTDAMTLSRSTGCLLVGTTSGSVSARIVANNPTAATAAIAAWNADTVGDNLFHVFNTEAGGTLRGTIDFNRGAGLTRFNTASDGDLKNIKNAANPDDSVALIMSIPIDEWAWKDDPNQWSQVGPIAQKLHAVFPGAVSVGGDYEVVVPATYDEDGNERTPETTETKYRPWAVDKTAPVWHLVATCQKQQQLIEDLMQRVAALEAQ